MAASIKDFNISKQCHNLFNARVQALLDKVLKSVICLSDKTGNLRCVRVWKL
jgi:hypothetical protein